MGSVLIFQFKKGLRNESWDSVLLPDLNCPFTRIHGNHGSQPNGMRLTVVSFDRLCAKLHLAWSLWLGHICGTNAMMVVSQIAEWHLSYSTYAVVLENVAPFMFWLEFIEISIVKLKLNNSTFRGVQITTCKYWRNVLSLELWVSSLVPATLCGAIELGQHFSWHHQAITWNNK